jgi:hypothetical protein
MRRVFIAKGPIKQSKLVQGSKGMGNINVHYNVIIVASYIIIIINGATAQSQALASLTGFVTGILQCGLSAPRSTCSSHPNSTTRDI